MPIEYVDLAASEAAMEREHERYSLPELFMENSRLQPYHAPGLRRRARELAAPHWQQVLRQSCKTYASSPCVALADPRAPRPTPTYDAVAGISVSAGAAFSSRTLEAADLSRLLFYACGAEALSEADAPAPRKSPAPDELHPLELYVIVISCAGIPAGIYHFNRWTHALEELERTDRGSAAARVDALFPGATPEGTSVALVITAVPIRVCTVHGDRGYRMLLTEAGRVAERLRLGAVALGARAPSVTDFYDERADRLLGLDGVDELTVAVSVVGQPAEGDAE